MKKEAKKEIVEIDVKNTEKDAPIESKVNGAAVTIGGRKIPLEYSMAVQLQVEEELKTDYYTLMNRLNKDKLSTKLMIGAVRLMGNEGLQNAGEAPDLTDEWLVKHMDPSRILDYKIAALAAIMAGWYMETDTSYEEEQDETLNEIRKKNGNTD